MTVESPLHEFLRSRGLSITVAADTGVTPPEPDQYWSVWISDSQHNNAGLGRCSTESSDGDTSPDALMAVILKAVEDWKREFEPRKTYRKKPKKPKRKSR